MENSGPTALTRASSFSTPGDAFVEQLDRLWHNRHLPHFTPKEKDTVGRETAGGSPQSSFELQGERSANSSPGVPPLSRCLTGQRPGEQHQNG